MFLRQIVRAARKTALLAFAALASLPTAAQFATLVPPNPRYMEPVKVRLTTDTSGLYGYYIQDAKVRMQGNVIEVVADAGVDLGARTSRDYLIGQFPAGDYVVRARLRNGDFPTELRFTVPERGWIDGFAPPPADYTGLYFDPAEPGWGMSVAQSAGAAFFIAWFVYDEQRRPTWYTIQGGRWDGCYRAPLVRTQGPPLGAAFDPRTVVEQPVGEATVCFPQREDSQGTLSYQIGDAPRVTKRFQRQPLE